MADVSTALAAASSSGCTIVGAALVAGLLGCGASGFTVEPDPGGPPMDRAEAVQYALSLVNRDRRDRGLAPVEWDEVAARAGQRHAEDMARGGFTAHFGSDGSVPEQRYTEAGGTGMVMENVGCFADGVPRELEPDPRFMRAELERVHRAFMDEVPPLDGHRRNILTPWHTHLGVGLAKAKELGVVCMAHELVDDYGDLAPLPREARVGDTIDISGRLTGDADIGAVGVARIDLPAPLDPGSLNKTGSYVIPNPYVTYFPKGFKTPIELAVDGKAFSIEVPLDDGGRAGLYEVSVWGRLPGDDKLTMFSLRTIAAR